MWNCLLLNQIIDPSRLTLSTQTGILSPASKAVAFFLKMERFEMNHGPTPWQACVLPLRYSPFLRGKTVDMSIICAQHMKYPVQMAISTAVWQKIKHYLKGTPYLVIYRYAIFWCVIKNDFLKRCQCRILHVSKPITSCPGTCKDRLINFEVMTFLTILHNDGL